MYEGTREHEDFASKRSNTKCQNIQMETCDRCEMRKRVQRWWVTHDTPEFGRMLQVAKRKGMSICDSYTLGWAQVVLD